MAILPDIDSLGPRPVPQPSRGMAQVSPSAAAAPARAMGELGRSVREFGDVLFERETTAQANEREAMVSDRLRALLYDPEVGLTAQRGQNAVSAQSGFMAQLDALREEAMADLNATAAAKLRDRLDSRIDGASQTANLHILGERERWLDATSEALIATARENAIANPAATEAELATIRAQTIDLAHRRGFGAEATEAALREAEGGVFADQVTRIAASDPVAAMEYLRRNEGRMLPSQVADLEAKLQPIVRERAGRALGQEAYAASRGGSRATPSGPPLTYSIPVEYAMGPNRPNPPSPQIQGVIGRSVEDVLGTGARVVITSGQETDDNGNGRIDPSEQHGSDRHGTGLAADVAIYRPDGSRVRATDPEMAEIARAAARNGALGIGFGAEYMGGDHIHIDMVAPGAGQAHTWSSGANAISGELVGLMQGGAAPAADPLADIMAEPDPDLRDAALREYERLRGADERRTQEARDAAVQAAFAHIEGGGRVDDLPLAERQALGPNDMASLRAYERSRASGVTIQTDPALYVRLTDLAASDPQAFLQEDPLAWRNSLSESDWQRFTDMRGSIQANGRAPAEVASASTLMTLVQGDLAAAGVERDSADGARFQEALLRWAEANPGASQSEQMQQARRLLVPVFLNNRPGDGMVSNSGVPAFQVDFDGNPLDPSDDITLDEVLSGDLALNGRSVAAAEIAAVVEGLATRLRRDPSPQEVIDALIATGAYQ